MGARVLALRPRCRWEMSRTAHCAQRTCARGCHPLCNPVSRPCQGWRKDGAQVALISRFSGVVLAGLLRDSLWATMQTASRTRNRFPLVPQRLAQARASAALTQEELAFEVGAGRRTVQHWEAGEASPCPRLARALAARLDVSVSWLCGLSQLTEVSDASQYDARLS